MFNGSVFDSLTVVALDGSNKTHIHRLYCFSQTLAALIHPCLSRHVRVSFIFVEFPAMWKAGCEKVQYLLRETL